MKRAIYGHPVMNRHFKGPQLAGGGSDLNSGNFLPRNSGGPGNFAHHFPPDAPPVFNGKGVHKRKGHHRGCMCGGTCASCNAGRKVHRSTRLPKGSLEAREHMARLRAMRRRK